MNAPWRQSSSTSSSGRQWEEGLEEQRVAWSSSDRKVMGAVEDDLDYLENCASAKVDLEALERLMEPEDEEVFSKVHPEVSRRKEAAIFSCSLTQQTKRTISWQAEGVGWSVMERGWPCKKVVKMRRTTLSINE